MIFQIEQTNDVKSTNVKYGKNRLETLLNRYKGAELMFLSIDGLSLTISRLSEVNTPMCSPDLISKCLIVSPQ